MARILIVDDAEFMRMTIKEILEKKGHEVVGETDNLETTLELYKKNKPDLVTMDILMKESGVEIIKALKEIDKQVKIIVISVINEQETEVVDAIKAGAEGFVEKPVKKEVLISEVDRVLNLQMK